MNAQTLSSGASPERSDLRPGDRIQSIHAWRLGSVVKVYPDGSAAILWDDGEPKAEGLAHERMPRHLLLRMARPEPKTAPSVPADPPVSQLDRAPGRQRHGLPCAGNMPPAGGSIERRKAYGRELCKTLLRYTDDAETDAVVADLEALVCWVSEGRYVPGLVAARYHVFRTFWSNVEVRHG